MLRVNFSAYNTYVTDSLFQWDKNRKLVISGLNLPVAPEIRFTNEIMDKSIVRQSVLEEGIITACIPNSLLQYHYTIKAYVGIYENDAFKTLEIIHIPVNPQERPLDYTFTDSEDEVYSFNALDNKVEACLANYAQADKDLQDSIENYERAREEFIEGLKEANKSFKLSKIYTSITQMNAGYATDNVPLYGFVLINTGNIGDTDNAKLFTKTETGYSFVAYMTGVQGEKGEPFTYEDFTPEQLELLRGPKGEKGDPGVDGITPTLQDWLGTEPIGSSKNPIYYDGEKFVTIPIASRQITLETASWEEINQIAQSGKASEYFYVGETKKMTLTTGEVITFVILGFDHDDLADGSGKAKITFGMEQLIDLGDSTYEAVFESDVYARLCAEVKPFIKEVTKAFRYERVNRTINYKTFRFTMTEVGVTSSVFADAPTGGTLYPYYNGLGSLQKFVQSGGNIGVSQWTLISYNTTNALVYTVISRSVSRESTNFSIHCMGFCI